MATVKVTVKAKKLTNLLNDGAQIVQFSIEIPVSNPHGDSSYMLIPIIIKDVRNKIPDKGVGQYVPKTSMNNHIDKLMLRLWGAITDYVDDDKDEANISNLLKTVELDIDVSERQEFMRKIDEVLAAGRRLCGNISFSFQRKGGLPTSTSNTTTTTTAPSGIPRPRQQYRRNHYNPVSNT